VTGDCDGSGWGKCHHISDTIMLFCNMLVPCIQFNETMWPTRYAKHIHTLFISYATYFGLLPIVKVPNEMKHVGL